MKVEKHKIIALSAIIFFPLNQPLALHHLRHSASHLIYNKYFLQLQINSYATSKTGSILTDGTSHAHRSESQNRSWYAIISLLAWGLFDLFLVLSVLMPGLSFLLRPSLLNGISARSSFDGREILTPVLIGNGSLARTTNTCIVSR